MKIDEKDLDKEIEPNLENNEAPNLQVFKNIQY